MDAPTIDKARIALANNPNWQVVLDHIRAKAREALRQRNLNKVELYDDLFRTLTGRSIVG